MRLSAGILYFKYLQISANTVPSHYLLLDVRDEAYPGATFESIYYSTDERARERMCMYVVVFMPLLTLPGSLCSIG